MVTDLYSLASRNTFDNFGINSMVSLCSQCGMMAILYVYIYMSIKIAGHTNTHTPKMLKIIKVNIFLRPEGTML